MYTLDEPPNPHILSFLQFFAMPDPIRQLGPQKLEIALDQYKAFWKKANEKTSCFPDDSSRLQLRV
jgi:hypothetical protein